VVLLTLTYIVSFIDRYILSLLIESIKASLHLTVQEPPRRKKLKTDEAGDDEAVITTVRETLAFFAEHRRSYGGIFVGIIGVTAIGAASFWAPALFLRTWGWDVGTSGPALGTAKDLTLRQSYAGVTPFLIADIFRLLLIAVFPGLALIVP